MTVGDLQAAVNGLSAHQKTNKLIALLSVYDEFSQLAQREQFLLLRRDREDDLRLQQGINIAVRAGMIIPHSDSIRWTQIVVDGMEPPQIARCIKTALRSSELRTVIGICGLSGIGKSTAVHALSKLLPKSTVWSIGDIFRVLAYLALQRASSREVLAETEISTIGWAAFLEQVEIKGSQVIIHNQGTKQLEQIKNNILKTGRVSRNLPLVAKYTQGQVIGITNRFIKANQNLSIIIEGRKATLQNIQADNFIELVVQDETPLGARRAAQRVLDFVEREVHKEMKVDNRLFLELEK